MIPVFHSRPGLGRPHHLIFVCLWLVAAVQAAAQQPSILLLEQNCARSSDLIVIQARIYDYDRNQALCTYTARGAVPLTLKPDADDGSLYWGVLPKTPAQLGFKSGDRLSFTVIAGDADSGTRKTAAVRIDDGCPDNPPQYSRNQQARNSARTGTLISQATVRSFSAALCFLLFRSLI